jgi:hypothetical protein|tara:strand:- start:105 stop:572 length:468 start_codon:yes stop_codon:yes gene_type:complete
MKKVNHRDMDKLVDYLEKEEISAADALKVIKKEFEVNFNNIRVQWKMRRFSLYLWARLEEEKSGYLGKKSDTIRRLVRSRKYIEEYKNHGAGHFYLEKADKANIGNFFEVHFKQLNHLITDPRQVVFFREKYFMYEGKKLGQKAHIPQEIIDRIR